VYISYIRHHNILFNQLVSKKNNHAENTRGHPFQQKQGKEKNNRELEDEARGHPFC